MPLPLCVRMMQDPRLQFAGPDDEGCTSTLVTDGTVTPKDTTNITHRCSQVYAAMSDHSSSAAAELAHYTVV